MREQGWNAVKRLVYDRAQGYYEYCQTCEANLGQAMHVEHIDPAGGDTPENLCLACSNCNLFKSHQTHGTDPVTGRRVRLFNPRQQRWRRHFRWSQDGVFIIGHTTTGRATVVALHLNNMVAVTVRRNWVAAGWHPPTEL